MANSNLILASNTNSLLNRVEVIQQSCAVPFRKRAGRIEFCLITSKKKGQWIFPKGVIEPGETPDQTALKEALEEAGLLGVVVGEPLAEYQYAKKSKLHAVTVFMMDVSHCEQAWPESDYRKRRWAKPSVARQLLTKIELIEILDAALRREKNIAIST